MTDHSLLALGVAEQTCESTAAAVGSRLKQAQHLQAISHESTPTGAFEAGQLFSTLLDLLTTNEVRVGDT